MDEISVLVQETPRSSLAPVCADMAGRQMLVRESEREASADTEFASLQNCEKYTFSV